MTVGGSIQLGRYTPGRSPAHCLDTRIKVLLTGLFSVAIWKVSTPAGLALMAVLVLGWAALARSAARHMLAPLRGMSVLGLFVLGYYLWSGVSFGGAGLAGELLQALWRSALLLGKIALVLAAAAWLYLYTPPLRVVDALSALLAPLERLHVPVRQFAFSVGLVLRFFPEAAGRLGQFHRVLVLRERNGAGQGGFLSRAMSAPRRVVDVMVLYMHYSLHSSRLVAQGLLTRGYNPFRPVHPPAAARPAPWEWAVLTLSCTAICGGWLWL
ncbi:energy-coupling factor transporter transmembrane protein EcfT [bacterium]|nr:energy-coupling factor transporter transmembrane protein EcfT [bacterium]